MNVQVSGSWGAFIESQVRSGRYRAEDEVVDEALSLPRRRDQTEAPSGPAVRPAAEPVPAWKQVLETMRAVPDEAFDRMPATGPCQSNTRSAEAVLRNPTDGAPVARSPQGPMRCVLVGARSEVILSSLFALLLLVSGCSTATRTVNVAKLGPANQTQIYKGGKPVLDRPVGAGSAEERAVTSWLNSHADGWQPSLVTYAPGRRVRGENFVLNFTKNTCVLNYRANDKGDWAQIIRPISSDEPTPNFFAPVQP